MFPIIEESESLNARAATEEHKRLTRGTFADLADDVGLLHGRMSAAAKERVMRAFRDGEMKILVSTAVIEVGIDVPNASIILIEGAERFGLAQLHQLRGRVGRGGQDSHCLLMSETTDPRENARLRTLQTVRDGFALAERDLELRGPGDVIGTRQSGALGFRFASVTDLPIDPVGPRRRRSRDSRGPRTDPARTRADWPPPWRVCCNATNGTEDDVAARGRGLTITAGVHRGRRLRVPPGIRPTTDRVRAAIFDALQGPPPERVLDLYAGSGAFGIEALSRGAGYVVLY